MLPPAAPSSLVGVLSLELCNSLSADLVLLGTSKFLLLPKFGDGDLLLADLNLSCLGDVSRDLDLDLDLDLNLLDGSLISLGPSLLVILLSCGGEGLEYLLSSKGAL